MNTEVLSTAIGTHISGLAYHTASNRYIAITWPDNQGEWTAHFTGGTVQNLAVIDQAVSGILTLTERP